MLARRPVFRSLAHPVALAALLLAATCVPSPAQDGDKDAANETTPEQQLYMDFLSEEGFRPYVDSDGDVGFKYEGGKYFIVIDEDDDMFFRLIYPGFWDIESDDDRAKAFEAIEDVNRSVKTGKIYLINDRVWAGVESFVPERDGFSGIFNRSLSALQTTSRTFINKMNE